MIVLPAIDIKNGKCVRLKQGMEDCETIYFDNPLEVALRFEQEGAEYLHLVDLDGAFNGRPKNLEVVQKIVRKLQIPVELGGGIRTQKVADHYINIGLSRIIIGTQAVKEPEFVQRLLDRYDEKICVSIDAKNGMVCTEGWVENSNTEALELASWLERIGLSTLVYTDITKDGMLSGPNFEMLNLLNKSLNMNIIASGGIASEEHLDRLKAVGLYGAITGKALYEGRIRLAAYLKEA